MPLQPLDELCARPTRFATAATWERVFEQGRRSFIRDVKFVYRFFIRLASPEYVAKRASQIYSIYYKDNGSLQLVSAQSSRVELRYEGVNNGCDVFWAQSRGSITGALEATGMKNVVVEIIDGGGDAKHCSICRDLGLTNAPRRRRPTAAAG